MGGIALRALIATAQKGAAAKPCERFVPGPVTRDRMERLHRESMRIASILASDARNDALLAAKSCFHAELVSARLRRKTRDDFAFVTRLRWAEQWMEIGLLTTGGAVPPAFLKALAMIEEARQVFSGELSPGCAEPETEIPPLVRESKLS